MSPIPNKGFFDLEPQEELVSKTLDSVKHLEERSASIKAEHAERQKEQVAVEDKREAEQAQRERMAHEQEIEQLTYRAGLVRENETRDMLLDRIRKLRETKEEEPRYIGRNEALQTQYELEQAAGRAAVAAAEKREAEQRALQAKIEEDDRKRLGSMEPVFRPNEMEPKAIPPKGKK